MRIESFLDQAGIMNVDDYTQKTTPPAPANKKKGMEAVAMAAYCWARVTS